MTDRERFEKKAIENGAKVLKTTDTVLTVLNIYGEMVTTYIFNKNGKFEDYYHNYYEM